MVAGRATSERRKETIPRVSRGALEEVFSALETYISEVGDAPLTDNTKATYQLHANNFVKWLNDESEPGIRRRKEISDLEKGMRVLAQGAMRAHYAERNAQGSGHDE